MNEPDCLFCQMVAGDAPADVVYETDTILAFRDINPQAPTHVLVIPKEHYDDAATLANDAPDALVDVIAAGAHVAGLEGIRESGYRTVFNTGDDAGRIVFHAHLHLLGGGRLVDQFGRSS